MKNRAIVRRRLWHLDPCVTGCRFLVDGTVLLAILNAVIDRLAGARRDWR